MYQNRFVLLFISLVALHSVTCKWIPPCQKVVKREAIQPESEKCDCEAEASNLQPGYILLPLNGEGFDWSLIEKLKQILSNNIGNKTVKNDDDFDYDNNEEYAIGKDLVHFKDQDFIVLEKAEDDAKLNETWPSLKENEPTPGSDGNYMPPIELATPSIPSVYVEEDDDYEEPKFGTFPCEWFSSQKPEEPKPETFPPEWFSSQKPEEPKPETYPPERFSSQKPEEPKPETYPPDWYSSQKPEEPKSVTDPPEWFSSQKPEEHCKNDTSTTQERPKIQKNETVECKNDELKAEIEYYIYKLQLYHNLIEYQQNLINHIMQYLENSIATNNQHSHHHNHHPHFEYNEYKGQNDYCGPQASKNKKQAHI